MIKKRRKILSIQRKPELVCPAGDWPSLVTAVANGADSVYFGIKGINMRDGAVNFDILEIKKIMDFLHKHRKKGYLALNTLIRSQELNKVRRILKEAKSAKVDAVILWDMAVFSLAKKLGLSIHLSTQASVANIKALAFYARLGIKRIVLARECTLKSIREMAQYIKKEKIRCKIETFIHGAMCISISGRCFLSYYSSGNSANRGQCRQYCRREFSIKDTDGEADYVLGNDYILSAKDLCAIEFIEQLIEAPIDAFKIEGRMRSAEYLKVVTSVYRRAIDSFFEGKLTDSLKSSLGKELQAVFNRGFSSGFYFGKPRDALSSGLEHMYEKVFLGQVTKFYKKISVAEVLLQSGSLNRGKELLFIGKNTPACFARAVQLQQQHVFVEKAGKGELVGVKLPFIVKPKDKVFLWQKKSF